MSIRITQGHLFARALADVNRSLFRFNTLQGQIASGRRVAKPSDDPAAALRILPLQNDLRNLSQLTDNVALARETLDTGSESLEGASELMDRLRELAIQASNGTFDGQNRASIGGEMDQLLQQLVSIGNSRLGDRYLFGGTESGQPPFRIVDDAGGTRVAYDGNHDRLAVEVAPGVTTSLNVPGDDIFAHRDRRGVTFTGDTGARPAGVGDTAHGYQTLRVAFNGLHTDTPSVITAGSGESTAVGSIDYVFTNTPPSLSIGGGPALAIPAADTDFTTADGRVLNLTVAGLPAQLTGTFTAKASLSTDGGATSVDVADFSLDHVAVRDSFDGSVLQVDVRGLIRTGDELVKHEGTFDAFTVIITLRDLLQNADGLPDDTVRTRTAEVLGEIDGAHDAILDGLRELGFRSSSMQALQSRVSSIQLSQTASLSNIQDTDMAAATFDFRRQDIAYQAALQVSSRVMQISILNFL